MIGSDLSVSSTREGTTLTDEHIGKVLWACDLLRIPPGNECISVNSVIQLAELLTEIAKTLDTSAAP